MLREEITQLLKEQKTRLRELRELHKYSLGEIASAIDVPIVTYRRLESSPVGSTSVYTYMKLAAFYGVSLDYLLGLSGSKPLAIEEFLSLKQVEKLERAKVVYDTLENENSTKNINTYDLRQILNLTEKEVEKSVKEGYQLSSLVELGRIRQSYPYNLLIELFGLDSLKDDFRVSADVVSQVEGFLETYLDERSINILHLRYLSERTLEEIGDIIGASRNRVNQIEQKALITLRRNLTDSLFRYTFSLNQKEQQLRLLEAQIKEKSEEVTTEDRVVSQKQLKLSSPIGVLLLNSKEMNALKNTGCKTLKDIIELYRLDQIQKRKGVGRRGIVYIYNALVDYGVLEGFEKAEVQSSHKEFTSWYRDVVRKINIAFS
jgi:sigma-70, region 4